MVDIVDSGPKYRQELTLAKKKEETYRKEKLTDLKQVNKCRVISSRPGREQIMSKSKPVKDGGALAFPLQI